MKKTPMLPSVKSERDSTKYYLKKIIKRASRTLADINYLQRMFESGVYWKVEDYKGPFLLLTKYLKLAFTYRWLRCSGVPYCECHPDEGRYFIDISHSPYIGDTVYACVNMGIKGDWLEFSINNQTLIIFNKRQHTLILEGVEIPSGLDKSDHANNPIYNLYCDPLKGLLWKLHDYAQDFTQTYQGRPRGPINEHFPMMSD